MTDQSPRRSLSTHVAAMLAARVSAGAIAAITGLLIPRLLGKADYGNYSIPLLVAGMLVVLSDLGLTTATARFLAEGRMDAAAVWRIGRARFGAALGGGLVLVAWGAAVQSGAIANGRMAIDPMLLYFAGAIVFGNSMIGVASGLLPTLHRVGLLAVLLVLQPIIELAGVLVVWSRHGGGADVILASTVAALLVGIAGLVVVARALPRSATNVDVDAVALRALVRYSTAMFVVWVCYAVFGLVDQVVLWQVHGAKAAAPYMADWRLMALMHMPGFAAATVVAPRLVSGGVAGRGTFLRWLALIGTGYVGMVAIAASLSGRLVPALLGAKYADAAPLFVGLAPYAMLLGVAPLVTMAANFLGGSRRRIKLGVVTVVVNVVLDVLLVPGLGAWGAVVGTTAAFGWYLFGHLVLTLRLFDESAAAAGTPRRERVARGPIVAACFAVAWSAAVASVVARAIAASLAGSAIGLPDAVAVLVAAIVGYAVFGAIAYASWTWAGWPLGVAVASPRTNSARAVRVLHVSDFAAPYPGAFIAQLRMLAEDLERRDAGRVAFAFPARAEGRDWLDRLRADGYEVHLLPEPSPRPTRAQVLAVARVVGGVRPDVVHAHFGTYDLAVARALRGLRRRGLAPAQVWHYRTALETTVEARDARRRIKDLIRYRWGGRDVDLAVGVTEAMAVEVAARGLGRRARGIVAGCDTDRFRPDARVRAEVRAELGIADDEVLVLHLGWHWQRKGGDLLAAAARELDARDDLPRIIACSIGAPAGEVEAPVRALEPTDEVQRLHQASDIFVSASRSEGFGNGLVEAMACGRVAVATLADGQRELFEHVVGCRTAPLDDAAALAAEIAWLLEHRDQWTELGASNREHVVTNNSMRRWARQMADAYEPLRPRVALLDRSIAPPGADAARPVDHAADAAGRDGDFDGDAITLPDDATRDRGEDVA